MASFEISATSCSFIGDAELAIVADFLPSFIKESAKIKSCKIEEEISKRHPEDAIIFSNLSSGETSGSHVLIDSILSLLGPFFGLVSPGSTPLSLITPRVAQLN